MHVDQLLQTLKERKVFLLSFSSQHEQKKTSFLKTEYNNETSLNNNTVNLTVHYHSTLCMWSITRTVEISMALRQLR